MERGWTGLKSGGYSAGVKSASNAMGDGVSRACSVRSTCGVWRIYLSRRGIVKIILPPSPPSDGRLFKWSWIAEQRGSALTAGQRPAVPVREDEVPHTLHRLMVQIKQYFSGERSRLIVPYVLQEGTPFMRKVWECMRRIPFGDTSAYEDIAASAGSPRACRAVGNACAANPLPLIVPCHRVVGKRGLGGFSAGTKWKAFLLSIEAHRGRVPREGG